MKQNNKVLVFGGSGFLGSHVVDKLSQNNFDVTIFDKNESIYKKNNQKYICGDILSHKEVNNAVKNNEYVYNFAGLSDLNESINKPIDSVNLNILGTVNILDACKNHNIKKFIFASTIYVYSKQGSFYKVSKQACENYIENFYTEFGLKYKILRYGSLYGARSNNKNGLYRFIYDALVNKKLEFNGDPKSKREFINVEDAADCTVDILDDNKYKANHITITGNQLISISELFEMISEILKQKLDIKYIDASKKNSHYALTPYEFSPTYGKKIVPEQYIDLGQGLLKLIENIDQDVKIKK